MSTRPLVVGVIPSAAQLSSISSSWPTEEICDLVELRLDSLALKPEEWQPHLSQLTLPALITARHPDEGGEHHLTTAARQALLEAALPHAALMDVELRSAPELLPLIRQAQTRGVGVIGSFHDFHSTPADEILQGAVDFALQLKLDAVKIATTLRGPEDLARLIQLLSKEKRLPLSVMGMGNLGPVSRLTLAKCGSLLNYGHMGQANAPGQIAASRLKEWLNAL